MQSLQLSAYVPAVEVRRGSTQECLAQEQQAHVDSGVAMQQLVRPAGNHRGMRGLHK